MDEEDGGGHIICDSERRRKSMEMILVSGLIYSAMSFLSCIMHVHASLSSPYGYLEISIF